MAFISSYTRGGWHRYAGIKSKRFYISRLQYSGELIIATPWGLFVNHKEVKNAVC